MRSAIVFGAAILGLVACTPARGGGSVLHLTGTILCGAPDHPGKYSISCSQKTKYLLVTKERALTIQHQTFSALPQLVGSQVNVIGEIRGRYVDILKIEIDTPSCPAD